MGLLIGVTTALIQSSIEAYQQRVEGKKRLEAFKEASRYVYVPPTIEYEEEPEAIKINVDDIDPPIRRSD